MFHYACNVNVVLLLYYYFETTLLRIGSSRKNGENMEILLKNSQDWLLHQERLLIQIFAIFIIIFLLTFLSSQNRNLMFNKHQIFTSEKQSKYVDIIYRNSPKCRKNVVDKKKYRNSPSEEIGQKFAKKNEGE